MPSNFSPRLQPGRPRQRHLFQRLPDKNGDTSAEAEGVTGGGTDQDVVLLSQATTPKEGPVPRTFTTAHVSFVAFWLALGPNILN